MRTLSEIFTPGAPTLPEGLRTLVVSPERELEPGMTVRAGFTFRNNGGATATGVRVRFNLPDGLVYLVGSGRANGADLDDELGNSPLLAVGGAQIGDLAPSEERNLEIAYSVAGAIENGTAIELQAAVSSFELQPVGSNVVRLVVRSKPQLLNALTSVRIEARRSAEPGGEAELTIHVHNAGESSAHDVMVVAPIPEHASYVPGSARVNGREIERELGGSFDHIYAPIVAASLSASSSVTLSYRVRIDSPLPDGTTIVAQAEIASQETAAFSVEPATLTVKATPDFNDDRTLLEIEPATPVRPGERVVLRFVAHNAGTAAAEEATLEVELPQALFHVRGAARIDGRPARERRVEPLLFDLGRIDGGERVEIRTEAVVSAPIADATVLAVASKLCWRPAGDEGTRSFEREIVIRSEPSLSRRKNAVLRVGDEIVRPGQEIEAVVAIVNEGSAAAHDAVLQLHLDRALEDVRLWDRRTRISIQNAAAELGMIEPFAERRLKLRARVRTPYADRSEIVVGADLITRELGETRVGEAAWRVDSHPIFVAGASRLELAGGAQLRPNQLAEILLFAHNAGSDVARNVRARLVISPEARLESVEGATRERSSVLFGEIAPGVQVQAHLGLRLLRSVPKEHPLTVDAVLGADAMLPVPLNRLTIVTTASPDFSDGTLRSRPGDVADLGDIVEWVLHLRNSGDGTARRVHVRVEQPPALIYVPNSTSVNDVPIRDSGATAPLASERGIVLNEFDSGIEATIRWRDVIHNQMAGEESLARKARVSYDDRHDEIASNELRIRATPMFANAISGLQFGLEGIVGQAERGHKSEATEEPPSLGMRAYSIADAVKSNGNSHPRTTETGSSGTIVGFSREWLERALHFLEEARFGSLVTHLFSLRTLLPDAVGCSGLAPAPGTDVLREDLDRLFIKLRLPSYSIAPRDVESQSSRSAIERLLRDAAAAEGAPDDLPGCALTLRGSYDPAVIAQLIARIETAPLAGALPWSALARLMPDETPQARHYRTLLIERLDRFSQNDAPPFVETLQRWNDSVLDAALDVFIASLRVAEVS
jgi:uncharacterized repeat protein (TIGR01451 family)